MAFQQLYYTSCETGLAGYGGYQFNAVTPGTSPLVMREVEDRSVYEPPRWLLAEPALDEPEAYPVAMSYATSDSTDAVIVTNVMFAGTDYSGRPGNYFAHALVTSTPGEDFGPLLPAELWGAGFWRGTPIGSSELPELQGPLPRGVVDRAGVQAFLDARGTENVLPELLTAVWRAMAGERLVLLASHDANENIWWIAAVSYLLGKHLAARMTFTTYSHRPNYSRHHLIGIPSDAVPPDADASFQLFDLDAGKTPGGAVHPLAGLLADTGVLATEDLWRQASTFASGTEQNPDDWLGPVAAATGLLRGRLTASQTQVVVRWLPGAADRLPSRHVSVVLGVVLDQQDANLADNQLRALLELARRLRSPGQIERLEQLLAERAVTHIRRGEPAEPVLLGGQARQHMRAEISDLLRTATPPVALAALTWAAASDSMPSETELVRYGQSMTPPASEPELTRMLHASPAVMHGFLIRLAHEPPELAARTFAGPVGALVTYDDLAGYPALAEERLIVAAARQEMNPVVAYDRIVDIRESVADAWLLDRLWPAGCPPQQLADMLGVLADSPDPQVRGWFARQIQRVVLYGTRSEEWLGLARILVDRSLLPMLPTELAAAAQRAVAEEQEWHRVNAAMHQGDLSIFAELYADYEAAGSRDRGWKAQDIAALLARADPLAVALHGCPRGVMKAFCAGLENWLGPGQKNARVAANVFTALTAEELPSELAHPLETAFEPVAGWSRRDLTYLGNILSSNPEVAKRFQAWRESQRPGLARKLFGGLSWSAEER